MLLGEAAQRVAKEHPLDSPMDHKPAPNQPD
jgi:hypothetical protein